MFRLRCYEITLLIIAAICAIGGIVTWIIFPSVYKDQVSAHLRFEQNSDTSLGYSAFMWANPPIKNVMRFYFFNVTNPDEMIYYSEKPMINEIGPFSVLETEHKKYTRWTSDNKEVFYENYKRYDIADEYSCEDCSFEQIVTIPNPTEIGATAGIYDPQYGVTPNGRVIVSIALVLLGEYPFVSTTVREILFDGYNDALLSAAHSNIVYLLNGVFKGGESIIPIPVPDMPRMGFFQGYNNTQDEHYWVRTGLGDIDRIGEVVSWANVTSLPDSWWPTEYARSIRGSDSGSFCKTNLQKSDVIPMFQSFMCRSFNKTFLEETTVEDIPSYTFSVPYEEYDTTSEINKGFRYKNNEKVNYFPDWPSCPNKNASLCQNKAAVDCSLGENLCDNCCNGSFVNGTYLIPPGIFPLVCYPGRLQPTPFAVMYSPPHYLYSPPQMVNSVYGLNPDINLHRPMMYSHEPYSGTVTKVVYQLQVSMPMMKIPVVPMNMHITDSIVPLFWQGATATLTSSTYSKIYLGFVLVPNAVAGIKYGLCAISLFLVALTAMCALRRNRKVQPEEEKLVKEGASDWS